MQDLFAEAEKWKRIASMRRAALEKAKQDAAAWKKVAQVPLESRLKQAVTRRIATALRVGG
jgi:hypothetical protein